MNYTKERPQFKKYRVYMSGGTGFSIDEDEIDKIMFAINKGQPVKVRQGIFNPSFFVSMGIDKERYEEWKSAIKITGFGDEQIRLYPVLENLPDIFQGVLESPNSKILKESTPR